MGKRARRKQRALGLRKQAQAPKRPFVESQVKWLMDMDKELTDVLQGQDVR